MNERLTLQVADRIAVVTYCNPPVNTTDLEAYSSFTAMFRSLNLRDDVSVVILRTEGKGFMAGNNINEIKGHTVESHANYQEHLIDTFESIGNCRYPVICAVQGYALGAGFAFPAACDLIVASDDAYFALPEITLAVISGVGYALKMFPECIARYACMTGEHISAREMLACGAINKVVPRERLMDEVLQIARRLASMPPHALSYMKEVLNQHCNHEHRRKFQLEDAYTSRLFALPEKQEAASAFLEKRTPQYYDL